MSTSTMDNLRSLLIQFKVYNKAVMVHKDARIRDAMVIMEQFMEDFRVVPAEHPTDAFLMALYDGRISICFQINDLKTQGS